MSDALQHAPSFDDMVGLIKKLFTDYLQDIRPKMVTPEEIDKAWERYKTLNHLWRDEVVDTISVLPKSCQDGYTEGWDACKKAYDQQGAAHRSQILQEYKQYKDNLKYLGGPHEWTEEKVSKLNRIEVFEAIKGFNELITFLDSTCYAYEEGANGREGRCLKAESRTGAVWVKASTRFPTLKPVIAKMFVSYIFKVVVGTASSTTGEMICFDWGVSSVCLRIGHEELKNLEWLDEQAAPPGEREVDAVEFGAWIRLSWMPTENGWVDALGKFETTAGLYLLFKQQK